MEDDEENEVNAVLEYLRDLPQREGFHFDGWGYDGVLIKFEPQEISRGHRVETSISVAGGMFKSSKGKTVIRVEDSEEVVDRDPDEEFGSNRSYASLVLRFSDTQYGSSYRGQHMFSGVLMEALTYGEDVQDKLAYGTPLEEILYSEEDPLELNPPDAGVLAHLVGKYAWIILNRSEGFRSDDYEPRRSVEEDLRQEADWQEQMRQEESESWD